MRYSDYFINRFLWQYRSYSIMNNDIIIRVDLVFQKEHTIANRIMSGTAAFYNPSHLGQRVFLNKRTKIVNPLRYTNNNNTLNLRITLESFGCMNNDRSSLYHNELLRNISLHSLPDTACQ